MTTSASVRIAGELVPLVKTAAQARNMTAIEWLSMAVEAQLMREGQLLPPEQQPRKRGRPAKNPRPVTLGTRARRAREVEKVLIG